MSEFFFSETDRFYAVSLLSKIEEKYQENIIDKELYVRALMSINSLVPVKTLKGMKILNYNITPDTQMLIRSRINSVEVDICASQGSWGSLPAVVKKEIAKRCYLIIEMTSNCTVGCSFCPISNKGRIQKKISYLSLLTLLTFFKKNQKTYRSHPRRDILYWGTDPFDVKWKKDNEEINYVRLVEDYWKIMKDESRFLFTSTAVPIGEEFKILAFADLLVSKINSKEISPKSKLRISLTNANSARVIHIENIIKALHKNAFVDDIVSISDNRSTFHAIRGHAWEKRIKEISIHDFLTLNCRDDVVIGVSSIDGLMMEAASNERPMGESRFPIKKTVVEGTRYLIPHHYSIPDFERANISDIYPNTTFTLIKKEGKKYRVKLLTPINVHRALLRVLGVLYSLMKKNNTRQVRQITDKNRALFQFLTLDDISHIRSYLNNGSVNISMLVYMIYFYKQGFIDQLGIQTSLHRSPVFFPIIGGAFSKQANKFRLIMRDNVL